MKKGKLKKKIKVTVVVRNGFVEQILVSDPECLEADVVDLDNTDPDARSFAEECLEKARKELQSIN